MADDLLERVVVEVAHLRPRRDLCQEEHVDFERVADPRDDRLIEEGGRDVAVLLRAQPPQRFVHVELVADDVWAEPAHDEMKAELLRGEQLADRRMEARRHHLRGADHDARL